MNRIQTPRKLPPLRKVLPDFRRLSKEHTQIFALLDNLRRVASRLQTNKAQPFYSTREAAAFFGVSQPAVARVYRELEAEGLLARRRSSLTMLAPRDIHPRAPVRGVVGVPIWSYGHSHFSDWRLFFMRLEEHLRRHAFVADFIFFQRDDPRLPEQANRFLDHELDALLWLYPIPTYTSLLLQLADQGVAVAVVSDQYSRFPFPTYGVTWSNAVQHALTEWRNQGIRRVGVVGATPASTHVAAIAQHLRLEQVPIPGHTDAPALLRRLAGARDVGLVFPESTCGWNMSTGHTSAFLELLGTYRSLLFHNIELDASLLTNVQADFAVIDWDKLAERLAENLASGTLRQQPSPVVTQADLYPRAAANRFAELF